MPKKARTQIDLPDMDVEGIELDGKAESEVPVFDTCHIIRDKIRALLVWPGISQGGFGREIEKTFPDGRKVTGGAVAAFLAKGGPTRGIQAR
jgi:hypothetical protein